MNVGVGTSVVTGLRAGICVGDGVGRSWGGVQKSKLGRSSWGGQVGVGRSVNTGLRAGICVGDGVGRSWGGVQKSKLGRSSWGGQVGMS
jgi:hypothetical protein